MSTQIATSESPVSHMKVFNQAHQLPVVKSAATYVTTFYQQAKDYSPLVNSTLDMAETGVMYAGRAANPVRRRLDGNINKADDLACHALTQLLNRYPIISKEPEQVSACIFDATTGVRDGAMAHAGVLLASTPGQVALKGLAGYLRLANIVADITLPAHTSETSISFESSNLALREVGELGDKLYRRLKTQSLAQLHQLQEVSTKALTGLQSQLAALEFAQLNLEKYQDGMKDQTAKLWQQLQTTTHTVKQQTLVAAEQMSKQLSVTASALTKHTLELAQRISSQLVSVYAVASNSLTHLSASVQSALDSSKLSAEKLYLQLAQIKSSEDLTAFAVSQLREAMNLLQSSVSYLFLAASNFPLLKHASGALSNVTERCTSYLKPAQEITDEGL